MADALSWLQQLLGASKLAAGQDLPDVIPGMPGGGFPELPPPNAEELALGGVAGARRYKDRVLGRDADLNPPGYVAPDPRAGFWGGDPGIYGGPRSVTPGLDEVLPGPRAPPFHPSGVVVTKDDWARALQSMPLRTIEEAPSALPQRPSGPVPLDFWRPGYALNQLMSR